jgi:type IV pilus biogenesis protein CpaD/CtpE
MYRSVKFGSTALCLVTFLMVGCAQTEDEYADDAAAEPAEMPAPAPSDAITPDAGPSAPVVTQLEAKNNSGITGDVTATHTASDVTVQISLNGATEGTTYPAHIHTGTCESGGPVAVELTAVSAGQSSTTVENSRLPADQPAFVQVHDAGGNPVACSDLEGHGTAATTPAQY